MASTDFVMSDLSEDNNMSDNHTGVRSRARGSVDEVESDDQTPVQNGEDAGDGGVRRRRTQVEAAEGEDEDLGYGPKQVIMLFIPVSLCMLVVVLTIVSVNYYTDQTGGIYLVYTPFHPKADDTTAWTIGKSVLNALIVLAVVVVMTILLVLLYKYKCYKIIHGWLIVTSLIMLFVFSFIYLEAVFHAYNIAFDFITLAIFVWNFGCMGMACMHWKAPLRVLQAYHIIISALLALVFIKYLPEWTLWTVLAIIAIWDLVAVLAPHGPLRILVNLAQERDEQIFPSLIYTSTVAYTIGLANTTTDDSEDSQEEATSTRPLNQSSAWTNRNRDRYGMGSVETGRPRGASNCSETAEDREEVDCGDVEREEVDEERQQQRQRVDPQQEDNEEKGVKLGLGDFIFYSILVGKAASSGDWATTIAAYIAILMGLFFTLVLLAIRRKALPALPISILMGVAFNFGTFYLISPFITTLAAHQVFI